MIRFASSFYFIGMLLKFLENFFYFLHLLFSLTKVGHSLGSLHNYLFYYEVFLSGATEFGQTEVG